ncbi:LOW QUALITY PROTEIN: lysozyme g-like, partial [Anoplopoma fimbria]|uniref:LOW QUALITY PROTEIN: lysozyme g-like n=1 Tax=Anoplopoma fimbria TaxID=229290 RepID=UPI0023ECC484
FLNYTGQTEEGSSVKDKLSYSDVRASHTMAQTDAGRMEKYRSTINRVGKKYGIAPALIAAIISRESRAGEAKFPSWSAEQQLKGGIAAYNMGDGNVHSYGEVDAHTTGGDYSNDVVAKAQWSNKIKGY